MAKFWREEADPKKHRDFMSNFNEGGVPVPADKDNLLKKWVYCAEVRGFVFQFASLDQVKECLAFFQSSVRPSTRDPDHNPNEHYWHPWFCKLPKHITRNKNRELTVKVLNQLLAEWA